MTDTAKRIAELEATVTILRTALVELGNAKPPDHPHGCPICLALSDWRDELEEVLDCDEEHWPLDQARDLVAERDELRAQLAKLRLFAGLVLREHRRDMCDVEGGDVQGFATRAGLLEEVTATERCSESCACVDYGPFPVICYRLTTLGTAVLEALP